MNYNEEAIVKLQNKCPLCSSVKLKPILSECINFPKGMHPEVMVFNNSWINLLECLNCSFAFTQEIPVSPSFFSNRYDNTWFNPEYESESDRKSEILEDIFSNVKSLGIASGNLLDVGSFAGKLLKRAKAGGYKPHGVEINPRLATYCKEKLCFDVICSEFQKLSLQENYYQVITIIDVLEHLVDPKVVLQNLVKGLSADGVLVIKVPNYPMQKLKQKIANFFGINKEGIFSNFGHINHFTIESMTNVLTNSGLELVKINVAPSEKWENTTFKNSIKNLFRSFYYLFSSLLSNEMGLNICYYAKKRKTSLLK